MTKLASYAAVVTAALAIVAIGCGSSSDLFGSSSSASGSSTSGSSASGTGGATSASASASTSGTTSTSATAGSGGNGGAGAGGAGGSGMTTGQPPIATINHPGDMEMRAADMPIPFIGVGTDPEDGVLPAASLVWTSNLSGMIGTGLRVDASLPAGTHVVTLTVTDSDKNTGTDSITLYIK